MDDAPNPETVTADTRRWLERAVIGLNLCPFAKAVVMKDQVRWVVSSASTPEALAQQLQQELLFLAEADPDRVDTTLLIHPQVLQDFGDYNDFLEVADAQLEELELDGELQVASFHPDFTFADSQPDETGQDVADCSNRAPYPTLHLLRESSIDRAVQAFPDAGDIYERNIDTLRRLGWDGWRALWKA